MFVSTLMVLEGITGYESGIEPMVVELAEAKRGFKLLPKR
jgi:hypothetical protein